MAAKLERTNTSGIFRRHANRYEGGRRSCSYVVVWRHRGNQSTATFRTYAEAREQQGKRDAGERRPVARVGFADCYAKWIESYAGRTAHGSLRVASVNRRCLMAPLGRSATAAASVGGGLRASPV